MLREDRALKVDIVAHSAGGLLARYFVRFGGVDTLDEDEPRITFDGGRQARQVVLVGTPQNLSANATFRDNLLNILLYGVRQSTGIPARAD